MRICTAGHSTLPLEDLVRLLTGAEVELVADIRSKPRSRLPHFDLVPLQSAIEATGMRYRFLGDRLGGMPREPKLAAQWRQGHLDPVIVEHLRTTDEWSDGISELARVAARGTTICLLCSEADPDECHRKVVALDVAAMIDGATVVHLGVNGSPSDDLGLQEALF